MVFFLIHNNNYNIFNLQLYPTREQQLIFYLFGGGGGEVYLQLYPTREQQLIFYLLGEGGDVLTTIPY